MQSGPKTASEWRFRFLNLKCRTIYYCRGKLWSMTWLIFYKNNYKIKTYFGLKLGPLVSRIDLTAMALTEAVLLNNFFHLTFGACSPSIVTLTKNLSGCFVSAENLSKVLLSSDILMVMAECFYIKTYSHI